jgi:hypothetical protein
MVAEIIENEIKFILGKCDELSGTDELEMILRTSFHKVQETAEQETLRATDGWICEFCEEIFTGRDFEEAEIKECDICGCIACKPCMEEHFLEWESGYLCKFCDDKVNLAMEEEEEEEEESDELSCERI